MEIAGKSQSILTTTTIMIRSDTMTSLYLYSYDHLQPDHIHFIVYRVRAVMDTATIATETMQQITAIEEFRHQGAKIKTK